MEHDLQFGLPRREYFAVMAWTDRSSLLRQVNGFMVKLWQIAVNLRSRQTLEIWVVVR